MRQGVRDKIKAATEQSGNGMGGVPAWTVSGSELRFSLDREREIRLSVADAAGRVLRVLAEGVHGPGEQVLSWDGRDAEGRALPSGVYFAKLSGDAGLIESRKLVLLK